MTPTLRLGGEPSPLAGGTHDDAGMRPAIPFDPRVADDLAPGRAAEPDVLALDGFEIGAVEQTGWIAALTRSVRPICVGALMAIPTLGAASVGTVALFDHTAAMHAVDASTAFLAGIPGDIIALIGVLATGYSLSKTVERLKGKRV